MNLFEQRWQKLSHPLAKSILETMIEKQTNLVLSADVTSCDQLLQLAQSLGPYICMLKTHVDCLDDFTLESMLRLSELAKEHKFYIFEDRKFADIGSTSQRQYTSGLFQIVKWAHIVNAHALIGESLIHSLQEAARSHGEQRGLLLLANMSAQSFMLGQDYSNQVFDLAKRNREFVFGFISPRQRVEDPGFLNFSPGVHLQHKSDSLGQSYRHPRELSAVKPDGYIVGRGILQSPNPLQTACEYKDYCWKLFCDA